MAKKKTAFFCQNCGAQSAKWVGKCPSCGEWNTYVEEVIADDTAKSSWKGSDKKARKEKAIKLHEVVSENEQRTVIPDQELNRVLGGGLVAGSLVLIGGEPGIGKSTLLLELGLQLVNRKVLYVSGEESKAQVKMRAERMPHHSDNFFILNETSLDDIFEQVRDVSPELLIIDSIQTMHSARVESAPGSISQVRECTGQLMKYAKETQVPVFLIGHITKDGAIAGPKVLEHMVDTVIQFEGDRHLSYRILRTTKNRFGSTSELGIYEMSAQGLREVSNPSEILISQKEHELSGVSIGAALEGNRPLLIEIQSLVSPATYGTPQRSATGFDLKRLNMLLAVLEKRTGFRMGTQDVFLNIAGGIRVDDPAIDLSVCMSLISSYNDIAIDDKVCFAAEIGLGGEVRAINRIENRISEAEKLGFNQIFISKFNQKGIDQKKYKIKISAVSRLDAVIQELME